MKKMKALLVDDDEIARLDLKLLLDEYDFIEVIGEAEDAVSARTAIAKEKPDLMFLDVNMPNESGFDLLASLDWMPSVIFTSAYDEYAIKAFDVNALDYLVKPVNRNRFSETITRIEARYKELQTEEIEDSATDEEESITAEDETEQNPYKILFLKDGEKCWFVKLDEIRLVESEANYIKVFFRDVSPMLHRSMTHIEKKLPKNQFFRANRRQIINLDYIKEVKQWFNGSLMVIMEDNTEVKMSRRAVQRFKEITFV